MNKNFDCLTDEEILKEFVKRFRCDGAILVYLDSGEEFGFGRWRNAIGKQWVKDIFKIVKQEPLVVRDSDYSEQDNLMIYH